MNSHLASYIYINESNIIANSFDRRTGMVTTDIILIKWEL